MPKSLALGEDFNTLFADQNSVTKRSGCALIAHLSSGVYGATHRHHRNGHSSNATMLWISGISQSDGRQATLELREMKPQTPWQRRRRNIHRGLKAWPANQQSLAYAQLRRANYSLSRWTGGRRRNNGYRGGTVTGISHMRLGYGTARACTSTTHPSATDSCPHSPW